MTVTINGTGIDLGTRYRNYVLFGVQQTKNGVLNFVLPGGTVPVDIDPFNYVNEDYYGYTNFKSKRPALPSSQSLSNVAFQISTRQIYIGHGASLSNEGTVAATSTFSTPLSNFYPGTSQPYVVGDAGTLTTIFFNAVGIYYNAAGDQTDIMATSGAVSFKVSSTGVWSLQTLDRYNGYNSAGTNFPTTKVNFLIQNSVPTLVYTSRTSQPVNARSEFYTTMYIVQSL